MGKAQMNDIGMRAMYGTSCWLAYIASLPFPIHAAGLQHKKQEDSPCLPRSAFSTTVMEMIFLTS